MRRSTSPDADPFFLLNGQVSKETLDAKEPNIFIAIMGMTGAGKSTFISHCTDVKVAISDPGALQSCTQEVHMYRCTYFSPRANVYLVDTPGFDDTDRKDTDILKEIATWLTKTYKQNIQLSGILYLHRISDNRMGGCAHRNLVMFKKLCGPEGVKNVIFLTTFWEKVESSDGDTREQTLKTTEKFWGYFVEKGARVQRHWNNHDSAIAAIQNFVPLDTTEPPQHVKLAIQTEMVDSHKDLDQTSAGLELQGEFQKEREKMLQELEERAKEIQEEKDQELREILRKDQENQAKELQRRDTEIQELKISMERMHEKKIQQLEERLADQQNQTRMHHEEMARAIQSHRKEVQQLQGQQAERLADQQNQNRIHLEEVERILQSHRENVQLIQDQRDQKASQIEQMSQEIRDMKDKKIAQKQMDYRMVKYKADNEEDEGASDTSSETWSNKNAQITSRIRNDWNRHVDSRLTCLTCGEGFDDRDSLFEHLEQLQHGRDLVTGKPERYIRPYENQAQEVDPRLTCLTCEEEFYDRDSLFEHIEEFQHGRDLITGKPEKYTRPAHYTEQLDPYSTCMTCDTTFGDRDRLFRHIENDHSLVVEFLSQIGRCGQPLSQTGK
ncbi:hypothetical protein PENSOL_c034G04279 [Penicillium solitum]|uniref:C2H2-type domain-containing protein n=1 Tax=Penicillium solitum TaxID=60172 RepID=A0A1V6QVC9_9EURO|nr:uncharacterized protein PENSOL_c034G04279 [Penicillium solitum]OQD93173.1 hypothetical protein PENSOL_c034G04279 [Penicillium solitum]